MTVMDTAVACPHPEKRGRFRTLEFAEAAARARSLMAGKPIYAYPCECGLYHLTHHKPGKNKRRHPERYLMNAMNGAATLAPEPESVIVWSSEPVAETIEEMLDRARYGSTRAQSIAEDIDRLVIDLAAVLDQDAARLEKEARAAELRAEIALRTAELEALEADLFDAEPEQPAEIAAAEEPDSAQDETADDDPDEAAYAAPEGASEDEVPEEAAAPLTRDQIDVLVPHFMYDGRVRGWARKSGYDVSARGRISTKVVRMWIATHADEARV